MKPFKPLSIIIIILFTVTSSKAQTKDTVQTDIKINSEAQKETNQAIKTSNKPSLQSFILPAAMIAYGVSAIGSKSLKSVNEEVQEELWTEHPHKLKHVDTYLQFAPALSVYALNAFGVKGKNNFRDRTMIYLMSNIFVNSMVYSTKSLAKQLRPDGSNHSSFPSGHTAEAFASAEFLRMEYKNVSPWYGVAGYAIAAATGYLRMYNNKHWFSDVVAGAGIGILSTRLSYWFYPKIQHALFKDKASKTVVMPTYNNGSFGVGMVHRF